MAIARWRLWRGAQNRATDGAALPQGQRHAAFRSEGALDRARHFDVDEQWVDDLEIDNVWDASRDDDPENKQVSAVPLSAAALKVIDAVPDQGGTYVFTLNGREPIKGSS